MKTYSASVFSTEKYDLGESPFYDVRTKTLSWVDIPKGKLFTQKVDDVNPVGEKNSFTFEKPIGAAVPAKKTGSYVVAGTDGIYLLENGEASLLKNLSEYFESYQRSNDAKADPAGRLWFGSSVDDDVHEASGNLFCLDGVNVTCMQPSTKISNGMAWSRDRKKFYFSDSLQYAVFAYDYDLTTGNISNRQILFKVEDGISDGMCIDSEDNLWGAFWGGHRIEQRSTKNGTLLATVNVDAKNVTSCCFMGDNLDTLFITSSGRNQTGEYDGCLFTCKVDAKGLPCDYA
ncbi:MAG: SMP-30/gluconolactonase/LRE family protein [Treponema sp.]|nr:SMP-30/gluconolactonase/LRE family protein [Treponema sp.]